MWIVGASILLVSACLLVSVLASFAHFGQALAESRTLGMTSLPHPGKDAMNRV